MRGRSQRKKPGTEKVLVGTRLMEIGPGLHLCFYPKSYLRSFHVCKAFVVNKRAPCKAFVFNKNRRIVTFVYRYTLLWVLAG